MNECVFGWTAAYRQDDTQLTVRIALKPDPDVPPSTLAACQARWKTGIEQAWSRHFACGRMPDGRSPRDIILGVQWVSHGQHLVVRVKQGGGRSNLELWHTDDSGRIAAHEIGHLLGHVDEYADIMCPDRNPVGTGTLMDDVSGPVVARHCERFCGQIGEIVA